MIPDQVQEDNNVPNAKLLYHFQNPTIIYNSFFFIKWEKNIFLSDYRMKYVPGYKTGLSEVQSSPTRPGGDAVWHQRPISTFLGAESLRWRSLLVCQTTLVSSYLAQGYTATSGCDECSLFAFLAIVFIFTSLTVRLVCENQKQTFLVKSLRHYKTERRLLTALSENHLDFWASASDLWQTKVEGS